MLRVLQYTLHDLLVLQKLLLFKLVMGCGSVAVEVHRLFRLFNTRGDVGRSFHPNKEV
jgi:hypothetical protein